MKAIVRDEPSGRWRLFENPREIVAARRLSDVQPALRTVEQRCEGGLYAAGFIAYEASPAFDPSLQVQPDSAFPLLVFGLYDSMRELEDDFYETPAAPPPAMDWRPSVDAAQYNDAFRHIQERIRAGDTYQVNLTYRLRSSQAPDPFELFRHLVSAQAAPFGAYIETDDWIICCASPELFFQKDGRSISTRPMKGTAPRGLWFSQDNDRAEQLRTSEKERAENVMIVDMVRNDLGRIADPGSVQVSALFDVERYRTVWQMTSTVTAQTDASLVQVMAALFPPASITGAPKASTMDIIAGLECSPRRIYTGTIGVIEPGGRAQFNVAIRTALIDARAGVAEYGVGGGIVLDSDAIQERAEAELKAKVLSKRPPQFDLLETMVWKEGQGYLLIDLHLKRLVESAAYFTFDVNAEEIARQLLARAEQFAGAMRVRMRVSRKGHVALDVSPHRRESEHFGDLMLAADPIDEADPFLYHKTTHRAVYERAIASRPGAADVLLFNRRREVTESTIANLIVDIGGALVTPPIQCGLLPGTARAHLLLQRHIVERVVTFDELESSDKIFLVNSVRGQHPVVITNP